MAIGKAPFSFVFEDLEQAGRMDDLQARLLFLIERLRNFRQRTAFNQKKFLGSTEFYKGIEIKYESEINYMKELIANQPQQKKKHTDKMLTYNWNMEIFDEVTKLFNKIKRFLIDENSELSNFKNVFSEKPITKEFIPVKWHDGNATELLYFISKLMKAGKITKETPMNYKRLKKCFVKNDGKPFTEKFKALYNKGDILLSIDKKRYIDKTIKFLS